MKPSDIHPGLLLRVINSHGLGAPVGTLATVESVETSLSGEWLCLVQYHDERSPKQGTRLYRSHLWASDLGRFEIVTPDDAGRGRIGEARTAVDRPSRIQLDLPFNEGDYITAR